jgi:hypothetical protein
VVSTNAIPTIKNWQPG